MTISTGIRVAALADVAEGEGIAISKEVTGTADNIAILRDEDGSVWALDDTCTHETASLADGWVEDGHVECPLHSSKFCLKTGEVQGLPATKNACPHRVELRAGDIWLFPNETP
jgi:3-phenylpropionate/trans-cinnamate dioxygenase ferredoxin subunit